MVVNFSEHSEPEVVFKHVYQPGEIDLDDEDARISGALAVEGIARRSSEIARVSGKIQGALEIACSRCLQPTNANLDSAFAVEFVTAENYAANRDEAELGEQDLTLSIYDGDRVDIDEIVREQVLLDLPVRQLCSENCQGLCLDCGANKNIDACNCDHEEIDPRWNALKQLKIKN